MERFGESHRRDISWVSYRLETLWRRKDWSFGGQLGSCRSFFDLKAARATGNLSETYIDKFLNTFFRPSSLSRPFDSQVRHYGGKAEMTGGT